MTTTTTIDVDDVATDDDLVDELGEKAILTSLLPDGGDSEPFRRKALEDTMKRLSRRTPPISDADLNDVTELRDCVVYGALRRIYERAMTQGSADSLWTKKREWYAQMYADEVAGLMPTLAGEVRGPSLGIAIERR